MEINGKLIAKEVKIAIIVAKFNSIITEKLLEGAKSGLLDLGVDENSIDVIKVPGAFEIPVVANKIAKKYSAVITLGAIIKGETDHYDYVCSSVASGISTASLNNNVPVIFGVLTTDTVEQAMNRAGLKAGNKGYECAFAAIEMINVLKQL